MSQFGSSATTAPTTPDSVTKATKSRWRLGSRTSEAGIGPCRSDKDRQPHLKVPRMLLLSLIPLLRPGDVRGSEEDDRWPSIQGRTLWSTLARPISRCAPHLHRPAWVCRESLCGRRDYTSGVVDDRTSPSSAAACCGCAAVPDVCANDHSVTHHCARGGASTLHQAADRDAARRAPTAKAE